MKQGGEESSAGAVGGESSEDASLVWEPIEIPITISWSDRRESGESTRVSFQTAMRLGRADILRHLPSEPNKSWNRISLLKVFSNSLAHTFSGAIERRGFGKVTRLTGQIGSEVFDRILEILIAKRLVRAGRPPKYVRQRVKYFQITALGLKRIAEVRRSAGTAGESVGERINR